MANVIALVWDFDKTLVDGYMQDPLFEKYDVNASNFWEENRQEISKHEKTGLTINHDTYYLNKFIREAKKGGKFEGLSNADLRLAGKKIKFYPGVVDFFESVKKMFDSKEMSTYKEHDIKVENYIVSTGFKETIAGSDVAKFTDKIWGCEFIENDGVINEIAYSLDNTSKTRALFEINKGVGRIDNISNIDANTKMSEKSRRVHFVNMIYTADGPSDIPAFSVINRNGGVTFGVYPAGNKEALKNMEMLRKDGRVSHFAEADFREGTGANMWLREKIFEFADRIVEEDKARLREGIGGSSPKHLV